MTIIYEPGDILERYFTIGDGLYGHKTIGYIPEFNRSKSYNFGMYDCPYCDSTDTCVIPYNKDRVLYCITCSMAWETIRILDEQNTSV